MKIQELARRSDIMITSTLSMSIFPKDKRLIQNKMRSLMSKEEIKDMIDEKNAFDAMCKDHQYTSYMLKDKEKEYRDNYLKSFIYRSNF